MGNIGRKGRGRSTTLRLEAVVKSGQADLTTPSANDFGCGETKKAQKETSAPAEIFPSSYSRANWRRTTARPIKPSPRNATVAPPSGTALFGSVKAVPH